MFLKVRNREGTGRQNKGLAQMGISQVTNVSKLFITIFKIKHVEEGVHSVNSKFTVNTNLLGH